MDNKLQDIVRCSSRKVHEKKMEGIQQQNLDISNKWVTNNNSRLDNVEKYPRMIRYDCDQIETRQHHDHKMT